MSRSLRIAWLAVALAVILPLAACDDDTTPPVDNPPTLSLTAPAGGEAYDPGSMVTISWTASDDGTVTVDLSYTADGVAETVIASDLAGSSFDWTVPSQALFGVSVKAVATDDAGQTDEATSNLFAVVAASARGYVTAAVCQNCHSGKYDDLFNSGHPYKLNKVEGGVAPTIPNSPGVPTPPPGTGLGWGDISYLIGGYGWKARFMDSDGYILVTGLTGVATQYNLPDQPRTGLPEQWVNYHAQDVVPKPYTCGACHTTGWLSFDENGGVNQDGLVGILGTWEETGIRCEQCHGPGVNHVATKLAANINVNTSPLLCGSCHFRDTNHNVLASGSGCPTTTPINCFIRHHEQYDEMVNGAKQSFSCVDCHDPHKGVRYGNAAAGGITVDCESCHATQAANNNHPFFTPDCEDCHMGRATKSARAVHSYEGDVRTHIFSINPAAVGKADMFFVDQVSGNTHTRGYVTLDFACYSCHNDPSGVGGGGSNQALTDLSAVATGIHN